MTFARLSFGTGVSQAVVLRRVLSRHQRNGSDSNSLMDISRTPQDRESHGCHNDHAVVMRFWTAALRLIASGKCQPLA